MENKKKKFIEEYLVGGNITDISKRANISKPTAYKYLEDTEVRESIAKGQKLQLLEINRVILNKLELAINTISSLIESKETNAQTKLNACNSLFNHYKTITENVEIKNKIESLQDTLDKLELEKEGNK